MFRGYLKKIGLNLAEYVKTLDYEWGWLDRPGVEGDPIVEGLGGRTGLGEYRVANGSCAMVQLPCH